MKDKAKRVNVDLADLVIHRAEEREVRNPLRRYLIGGTSLALIILLVAAIGYWGTRSVPGTTDVKVATVTPFTTSLRPTVLTATGYVVPQRQSSVASKGTGRLSRLFVEIGDEVKHGAMIAQLEEADVLAQQRQAQARLNVSRAALANAEPERRDAVLHYQRTQELWKKGLVTQSEFETAETRLRRANAAVRSSHATIKPAEAEVQAATVDVENAKILAPFDGTIIKKFAEVGEVVAPLAASSSSRGAVVMIADLRTLAVEAEISESSLSRIHVDQPTEITLDAVPGHRYPSTVRQIMPTADRTKATVLAKIHFLELDHRVLPDMSATVTFLADRLPERSLNEDQQMAVPANAIVTRDDQSQVLLVREGVVVDIPVQTGSAIGGRVQIEGPLAPGDMVVVDPPNHLIAGSRVNPLRSEKEKVKSEREE